MSNRFNIKNASAKELFEKINLKYYDVEIEEVDKRIFNIRVGNPEFYGIYNHQRGVLSEKEAERKIKDLERYKESLKKKRAKYAKVANLAKSTDFQLESMAREDALFELFGSAVNDVKNHYDHKKHEYVDTKLSKKNIKKIFKARKKDSNLVFKKRRKITGKMALTLKMYSKKMHLLINKSGFTIDGVLSQSHFSIDSLLSRLYSDKVTEHKKSPSYLGVNTTELDNIKEIMNSEFNSWSIDFCAQTSYSKYEDLTHMRREDSYLPINSKLSKFINMYTDILIRAKELKALKTILSAFKNTEIKDSESFINLQEVCRAVENEIIKLEEKVDKEFEREKIPELIENNKKLEELYRNYLFKLADHKNSEYADYDYSVHMKEAEKYKSEMIQILFKYPELNRPEYRIDLEKYNKKTGEEFVTDPLRRSGKKHNDDLDSVEYSEKKPKDPVLITDYEAKVDRKRPFEYVEEPVKSVVTPPVKHVTSEKTEDDLLKEEIETPSYLSGLVTVYYPKYASYKAANPDKANLRFSEYLEMVRPDLKKLIEIERKRENRVETVYKKYIRYRASLKDKEKALSFRDFAKFYYNVESHDIPQEYEERAKLL